MIRRASIHPPRETGLRQGGAAGDVVDRLLHGDPGDDDRECRCSGDRGGLAWLGDRSIVGGQRLHAGVGGVAVERRLVIGPHRCKARVLCRAWGLHARVRVVRARAWAGVADRGAAVAGRRRRSAGPWWLTRFDASDKVVKSAHGSRPCFLSAQRARAVLTSAP